MTTNGSTREILGSFFSFYLKNNIGRAAKEGVAVILKRIHRQINTSLNQEINDPELASYERYLALLISVIMATMRSRLVYNEMPKIIDKLTIEEGTKSGLKLICRGIDLDDITSGGDIIDAAKMAKEIPVIAELSPDIREEFLQKTRNAYANLLLKEYADYVDDYLSKTADHFSKRDIKAALDLIHIKIVELNIEINKLFYS